MKLKKIAQLTIAGFLLTACATTVGNDFDVASVDKMKIGTTTATQTMQALGEPFSRNISADGTEKWTYQFTKGKGGPSAKAFVPVVGAFLKDSYKTSLEHRQLNLGFGNDILVSCNLSSRTNKTSSSVHAGGISLAAGAGAGTTKEIACGE